MRSDETKYQNVLISPDIVSLPHHSPTMEALHYTMADPQMVPVDLLDVILPEDIYRLNYTFSDQQEEDEEDGGEDEANVGVVTTVSRLLASPYKLFVYYLEIWIDGLIKRTSYEKY